MSALLRRTAGTKAKPGTYAELERLSEGCDVRQRLARAPGRFRVGLPPEDVVLNRTVLMDMMYFDGRSLQHVVDRDTLYSAASFCRGETVDELWQQYLKTWVHPYVGQPQVLHIDQAPQFESPTWKAWTYSAGSTLILSGIESHNALGDGERYHSFLRLIYRKVRLAHPGLTQDKALSMATATMNQNAGPRGLVHTLLVFHFIPRMPVTPLQLTAQTDRVQAMVTARKEMTTLATRVRVQTALSSNFPAAADRDINPGTSVLVYREPPADQWEGTFVAVAVKEEMLQLAMDGLLKALGIDKVKPYVILQPAAKASNAGEAHM